MSPRAPRASRSDGARGAGEVEEFLSALEHPLKREILAIRATILAADERIGESIKWNAPSFHTTEHFATFHLRAKDGVQLVLHLGAKPKPEAQVRAALGEQGTLLQWRSADRATVTFRDFEDFEHRREAFAGVVRRWIDFV